MIKKFIKIKNVGRFTSYNCFGDVELKKMNIIYSENGRGKTTLSVILRSLQSGKIDCIEGRKTLGKTEDPEIELLLDTGVARYKNKKWGNAPFPEIEIFDSIFVQENVYSGYFVSSDHKRRLYLLTIGEQGVKFANKYIDSDNKITKINQEIRGKKAEIDRHIIGDKICVENFVKFKEDRDIETKINKQEKHINSLSKQEEIKNKQYLKKVDIPIFESSTFLNTIQKNLPDVLDKAMMEVRRHIEEYLDDNGECWLETGLKYVTNSKCPFCGQDITTVDLVNAYKTYFSDGYNDLKSEVERYLVDIQNLFSQEKMLNLQSTINDNKLLNEFWKEHIDYEFPEVSFDEIKNLWDDLLNVLIKYLNRKKESLLEKIEIVDRDLLNISLYDRLIEIIKSYNDSIDSINKKIKDKKESIEAVELEEAKSVLENLQNISKRFDPKVDKLCNDYIGLYNKKLLLEEEKKKNKEILNKYSKQMFKKYEQSINMYLEKFGAGFRIGKCKPSFIGRKPSTNYCISINNVNVELGKFDSPDNQPSFKNTLSEGDKHTLALSFFLAKLKLDTDISNKVIIFDDPICSLDRYRRSSTVYQILDISKKTKQVIVLTHDCYFARSLWKDNYDNKSLEVLCIKRENGHDSVIDAWDIERETQGEYYQNYFTLAEYLETGVSDDLLSVARCIRPLLEGNIRLRFPREFGNNMWLGDFIGCINDAEDNDSLAILKSRLPEFEEINNYSKRYHHPNEGKIEQVNDTELCSYIERTLRLIGGIFNDI